MDNGHVQIDDADISTIVSALSSSPVFAKHRGSLVFDAFSGKMRYAAVERAVNQTRGYAPDKFFEYVQKLQLSDGKNAGLQFLSTLCSETPPDDAQHGTLTGIIKKYSSHVGNPLV